MKIFLSLTVLLMSFTSVFSQLTGTVKDNNGELLPFVNIYVKKTSTGTTTNLEGFYSLKLKPGNYEITYQFVGFRTVTESIALDSSTLSKDIVMYPEDYKLEEVVISANAEDPAYAIIRKAQAKRKYYNSLNNDYECDAYMRGINKIMDAPEKIMGIKVGDLDGLLDSTRQGVVYLSESVSKIYRKGGKSKEVMYSSKVSGDDQGYSFNSAKEMNFNFYDNTIELFKKMVSPIAANAMSYYDYKLEGAQIDENGQLVNKIKVIPKNEYTPGFFGHIYINEDLWNIHSCELGVTKKSTQLPFIDTLTFKQIFIPLKDDNWIKSSDVINFNMGAMGFKITGNFAAVYSNYLFEELDDDIFSNEVFKVKKEANERDDTYWESIRPIPLSVEERVDYRIKDSIRIVKESPEYMDSIDREYNKFKVWKLVTGYAYQNSKKRDAFNFVSPIGFISYNTIMGWNSGFQLDYNKAFNKKRTRIINTEFFINYGLSEKVWRPRLKVSYLSNRYNNLRLELAGGKMLEQYSRREPISDGLNTLFSLFFNQNYLKAFDKRFVSFKISRDLGNIFGGVLSLEYQDRTALINTVDFSNNSFTSNDPQRPLNFGQPAFENHQALLLRASLRIKIGEKIWNYPDQKFKVGSDWPTIWVHYKKALKSLGADVSYDLLSTTIYKNFSIGTIGNSDFFASAGTFLSKDDDLPFIDNYHFLGNQTHVGNPIKYYNRFLMLPYYTNSTADSFYEMHVGHSFQGMILNKIPLLKKLGWHLAAGYKFLDTTNNKPYHEFHVGIDNIGIKVFRLLRVDAVWSRQTDLSVDPETRTRFGVVLGVKLDL